MQAGLNPAFTPTSVIRKMANDKMEEKEKQGDDEERGATPSECMNLNSNDFAKELNYLYSFRAYGMFEKDSVMLQPCTTPNV